MSFIEERIPADIAPGGSFGPAFMTAIKTLRSGGEHRNQVWANPLRKFETAYKIRDREDIETDLLTFAMKTRGSFHGFRAKDWSDFEAIDEDIATADGTRVAFRLVKTYGDYVRRIMKPVAGTVVVKIDGVPAAPTIDTVNGVAVFTVAPTIGSVISWTGQFDVPVRFEADVLNVLMHISTKGEVPSVGLTEIRIRETVVYP